VSAKQYNNKLRFSCYIEHNVKSKGKEQTKYHSFYVQQEEEEVTEMLPSA